MAREKVRAVEEFFDRPDLPEAVISVRSESLRNAYITGALVVTNDHPGPGTRFELTDRLATNRFSVDEGRRTGMLTQEDHALWLDHTVREQASTIEWLHREVSKRDETVTWLHGEVAERDRMIEWLHAEVHARDVTVATLRAESRPRQPRQAP